MRNVGKWNEAERGTLDIVSEQGPKNGRGAQSELSAGRAPHNAYYESRGLARYPFGSVCARGAKHCAGVEGVRAWMNLSCARFKNCAGKSRS